MIVRAQPIWQISETKLRLGKSCLLAQYREINRMHHCDVYYVTMRKT